MKIAIVSPDYSSESYSSFSFVHARAKLYRKEQNKVEVFVLTDHDVTYDFEGITVHKLSSISFSVKIREFEPDVIGVHYPTFKNIPLIRELDYAKVAWIHGHEILWTLDLISSKNSLDWIKKRVVLFPRELYQIWSMRTFLQEIEHCVFVSKWLLQAGKRHSLSSIDNAVVIPNPVDTELFSYQIPQNIRNGISVRSMERAVYGLDVAIKAFAKFDTGNLTIYGKGRFFRKFKKLAGKLESNTTIHFDHINHDQLPQLYHQYGFFVAPSRRETQGLAMCEAMACGLPVVASKVGGIPEFVRDGVDGYLVPKNDPRALRDAVTRLLSDRERYYEMSRNARSRIESICDAKYITEQELSIMKKVRSGSLKKNLIGDNS